MITYRILDIKKPFIISICSGKGGVGKSVLVANLAYVLASKKKVLIWDADQFFPNQHLMFGVEPPVRLYDVYSGKAPIDKCVYQLEENLFIMADVSIPDKFDLKHKLRPRDIIEYITELFDFDLILMDTPAGGTYEALEAASLSDLVAIVITDEPTSLLDAYALVKIFLPYIEVPKIKLLVNNVIDLEDANDVSAKLNLATGNFLDFQLDYLGFVPYSRNVRLSIIKQELFVNMVPDEEVTSSIHAISEGIVVRLNELLLVSK